MGVTFKHYFFYMMLFASGFFAASAGIWARTGVVPAPFTLLLSARGGSLITDAQNACTLQRGDQKDIFFLSCGGIF